MTNIVEMVRELRQERIRASREVKRLDEAITVLRLLVGRNHAGHTPARTRKPKRAMSLAARRKISIAQRARWAKLKRTPEKRAA